MNGVSVAWKRPNGSLRHRKPRMFMRRTMKIQGKNVGNCSCCLREVNWRSVADRCWRCEMESIKTRTPMYIEREILMSLSGMME